MPVTNFDRLCFRKWIKLSQLTDALEELEEEWNTVWNGSEERNPFASFAWQLALERTFGNRSEFLILRDDKHAMGMVAISGEEQVVLAGNGISDYQGPCVLPSHETIFRDFFFAELCSRARGREILLENLPANSVLLKGGIEGGRFDLIEPQAVCPELDLAGPQADGFPGSVPKQQIDKVRYYRRRAEKMGALRFEVADDQTLEAYLDALFRLHRMRWETRGESGVLEGAQIPEFHRRAAAGLLKLGALRLYAMFLNDKIVGVYLGFVCGRRAFYYLSGFDHAVSELSPGTLLVAHAIQEAMRGGARTFDFLRGGEPYKYKWGARDTQTFRRRIAWM